MKKTVAEITSLLAQNSLASQIARMWDNLQSNRRSWLMEKKELRDYVFATDTTKTAVGALPWKNKPPCPSSARFGTISMPTTCRRCSQMTIG